MGSPGTGRVGRDLWLFARAVQESLDRPELGSLAVMLAPTLAAPASAPVASRSDPLSLSADAVTGPAPTRTVRVLQRSEDRMTAVENAANHGSAEVTLGAATLADVTERLMAEFEDRLDLATISRVVTQARHDLQPVPDGSLAKLVERLAHQRLLNQLAGRVAVPPPRRH